MILKNYIKFTILICLSFASIKVLALSDYVLKLYILNSTQNPIAIKYSTNGSGYGWHSGFDTYEFPDTKWVDGYNIIPQGSMGVLVYEGLGHVTANIDYYLHNIGEKYYFDKITQTFDTNNNALVDGYKSIPYFDNINSFYVTGTNGITVSNFPSIGKEVADAVGLSGGAAEFVKVSINFLINLYGKKLSAATADRSIEYMGLVVVGDTFITPKSSFPTGSYNQTCNFLNWYENVESDLILAGQCEDSQGYGGHNTVLNYTKECGTSDAGVINLNGVLSCEPVNDTCNRNLNNMKEILANKQILTESGNVKSVVTLTEANYDQFKNLCISNKASGVNEAGYIVNNAQCSWSPKIGWKNSLICQSTSSSNCYDTEIATRIKYNGNIPVRYGNMTNMVSLLTPVIESGNNRCISFGSGIANNKLKYDDVQCNWLPGDDAYGYPAWGTTITCNSILKSCQNDFDDIHSKQIGNIVHPYSGEIHNLYLLQNLNKIDNLHCTGVGSGVNSQGLPINNDKCTWKPSEWKNTLNCRK